VVLALEDEERAAGAGLELALLAGAVLFGPGARDGGGIPSRAAGLDELKRVAHVGFDGGGDLGLRRFESARCEVGGGGLRFGGTAPRPGKNWLSGLGPSVTVLPARPEALRLAKASMRGRVFSRARRALTPLMSIAIPDSLSSGREASASRTASSSVGMAACSS